METPLKTINAQAGQTWLMRNGQTMTIGEISQENGDFPILQGRDSWMDTGRYWSADIKHSKDLIKLVLD